MTAKYDNAFLVNAMEAFDKGMTLKEFGQAHGVSRNHLAKALRREFPGYVFPSQKATLTARAAGPAVVEMYEGGTSVLELSVMFGCSRAVIGDILKTSGVLLRDASKATKTRMGRLSREERSALALKARAARMSNLGDRARARVETAAVGRGEDELFDLLGAAGFEPERQVGFGTYAIDIVFRNVAVEVKFGTGRGFGITRQNEGDVKITESDRVLCIVAINHPLALVHAAGEVIAFLDFVSRQPPTPRQYWVVRCGFEDHVALDAQPDDLAVMAIPPKVTTAVGKRYLC